MKLKLLFLTIIGILLAGKSQAQVGIGVLTPDASALLEVNSNSKGFLPPVMTESQRDAISSPAEGLMLYCSNCSPEGYYLYTNGAWSNLLDGVDEMGLMVVHSNNAYGDASNFKSITSNADNNVALGTNALENITSGDENTAVGGEALQSLTGGYLNTAMGYRSMNQLTTGGQNVAIGSYTLENTSTAIQNTAVGDSSLAANTTGERNVAVGYKSGALNTDGSYNVYVGNEAGYNATGSNKLYIENSSSSTPLIGGDFSNGRVGINMDIDVITSGGATLQVGGDLSLLNGVAINEFSNDATLSDESDAAVPTELAVRTYVNNELSELVSPYIISTSSSLAGNSNDSLVSQQAIKTYVDNELAPKLNLAIVSTDASLNGNSNDSVVSQQAIKSYVVNSINALGIENVLTNKMSIDTLLTYNSNDSIATQMAVKTYVDNSISGLDLDNIITSKMSDNTSLSENSDDLIATQKAVKSYVDDEINDAVSDISPLSNIISSNESLSGNSNDSIASQRAVKIYIDALEDQIESMLVTTGSNYHTGLNNMESVSGAASNNLAIGYQTLQDLTTGDNNIAIGYQTLGDNTTGFYNTAAGNGALNLITNGSYNSAFGYQAGYGSSGSQNSLFGNDAGNGHSGEGNTYTGFQSGYSAVGDSNVFMGYNSGYNAQTSRSVFIGAEAGTNETNDARLYIENTNSSTPLIGGDFDNNIVSINMDMQSLGSYTLQVGGDASKSTAGSWSANSDKRLKTNITYMESEEILQKMLQLKGATYEWNDTVTGIPRPEGIQFGFIAQDIEKVWPEKITYDNFGYLMTAYGDYDPMFVESLRALYQHIQKVELENNNLKVELADLEENRSSIQAKIEHLQKENEDFKTKAQTMDQLFSKLKQLEQYTQQASTAKTTH